jgi:hypothetical protein
MRCAPWVVALIVTFSLGCSKGTETPPAVPAQPQQPQDEEKTIRGRFAEVQVAIKSGDPEKLWPLLDARSRADAERLAREVRSRYEQAGDDEKLAQEKELGLSGAEMGNMTGKGFLKASPFHRKFHELPDSEIDKVVLGKDAATVHFHEPDGDKEKAIFVREEGQWKVWLVMPKVGK